MIGPLKLGRSPLRDSLSQELRLPTLGSTSDRLDHTRFDYHGMKKDQQAVDLAGNVNTRGRHPT